MNDKEEKTDEYCRNLIDEIRREQLGIGESFGERETKLTRIHHDRLGRSLDRLFKELYTKDTHFVLELIQNADDNSYPDEMFTDDCDNRPTVAFIIEERKVVVLNNETGFEERNIKAICDVGKSTKGVHRKGYIGKLTFVLNRCAFSGFPAVAVPFSELSYSKNPYIRTTIFGVRLAKIFKLLPRRYFSQYMYLGGWQFD